MTTEILIYKYPKLKELFESQCKKVPIIFKQYKKHMFEYRVIAPYLNPHINITKTYFLGYKYSDYLYYVSMNSSNKAVNLLMKNIDNINLDGFVQNTNPNIGPLLEHSFTKFNRLHWLWMNKYSSNPAVMAFLETHPDKIQWNQLSQNTCSDAIKILEKNQDKINWLVLSSNPSAMQLINNNLDKVYWTSLCLNTNPEVISILEQNLDKIDFSYLSSNPNAIHILEQNLDKINVYKLSENPNAMDILMKHPELIDDTLIMTNPSALSYLEPLVVNNNHHNVYYIATYNSNAFQFIEKMLEKKFISNNNILDIHNKLIVNDSLESLFDLDYQAMSKARTKLLEYELMAKALHPSRVSKWVDYHYDNGGTAADFEYF